VQAPIEALTQLYARAGFPFTAETREAVTRYLAAKPQGKFGAHRYAVDKDDRTRQLFARYQRYFDVPSEE